MMTDHIRSSRRLIIIGAALLAAAAVVLVLGVVPPMRADTSPVASPASAAMGFLVQAAMAFFLALVLAFVAARSAHHPRSSVAILQVIGAVVFLLGIPLAGLAPAFLVHGPALHGAIRLMLLSAAAEFAATGVVVVAASRLGPVTSESANEWKTRIAPAALLGLGAFFLMFLVGEGMEGLGTGPAAEYVGGLLIAVILGGYTLVATYMLLRGLPRASRNLWIVLAMNAVLLLAVLIVLLVEQNKSVALFLLAIAIMTSMCSYIGLVLASRAAGRRIAFHGTAGRQAGPL